MNATRRSIRLTALTTDRWEVTAIDTTYLPHGGQLRRVVYMRIVPGSQISHVAHRLVDEHLMDEIERERQGGVEAAERE